MREGAYLPNIQGVSAYQGRQLHRQVQQKRRGVRISKKDGSKNAENNYVVVTLSNDRSLPFEHYQVHSYRIHECELTRIRLSSETISPGSRSCHRSHTDPWTRFFQTRCFQNFVKTLLLTRDAHERDDGDFELDIFPETMPECKIIKTYYRCRVELSHGEKNSRPGEYGLNTAHQHFTFSHLFSFGK